MTSTMLPRGALPEGAGPKSAPPQKWRLVVRSTTARESPCDRSSTADGQPVHQVMVEEVVPAATESNHGDVGLGSSSMSTTVGTERPLTATWFTAAYSWARSGAGCRRAGGCPVKCHGRPVIRWSPRSSLVTGWYSPVLRTKGSRASSWEVKTSEAGSPADRKPILQVARSAPSAGELDQLSSGGQRRQSDTNDVPRIGRLPRWCGE